MFLLETNELQNVTEEHLQLLGVGVLFALLISWIARHQGFYRFPLRDDASAKWIVFLEVAGVFAVFLVVTLFVAPLIAILLLSFQVGHFIEIGYTSIDPVMQGWLNSAAIILSAGGVTLYCFMLTPRVRHAIWGPQAFAGRKRVLQDLLTGALTWPISYPFVVVIGQVVALVLVSVFHQKPFHTDQVAVKYLKATMSNPFLFAVTVMLIVLVVPLLEEILFRGFLQTWIKQHLGTLYAILITSIIFSLFHFSVSQGLDNVELLLSLFLLSCFLGFLRERQHSLYASIGLHATFNAVTVIVLLSNF